MAIYYATTKPISRGNKRSATASAAYRAGVKIIDERSEKTHDYSKRGGVEWTFSFDKEVNSIDRSELWNAAEKAENRKDGRTAREWILAIPNELIPEIGAYQRDIVTNDGIRAATQFAKMLAERYNVAVDVAVHSPDKKGDNRNWHAHIMTTTREFSRTAEGKVELGDKASIELSNTKRKELGLGSTSTEIKELRKEWENIANHYLERSGYDQRINHRSLKEQGIERQPTIKMGWKASAMERRGIETNKGGINRVINSNNLKAKGLALEIRIEKYKLEEQKQALEFQQGMDALRAKQEAVKAQQHASVEREKTQINAQEQVSPEPTPQATKSPPVERLENSQNPHKQGSNEYSMAVHNHAKQLQQKEFAKIKLEIKAIKNNLPVEPVKSFFESKKTHQTNSTAYRRDLQTYEKTIENKERELNQKQRVSTAEYVRYEHHQAVRQQRPDLARESDKATAWDKETRRLQQDIEQLNKPKEQDHTKGKDIDW